LPIWTNTDFGSDHIDASPFHDSHGFGSEIDSLKAEWAAVNSCLDAYRSKKGNLYIQKAPELFGAIAAQCDANYNTALLAELKNRPANWSIVNAAMLTYTVWAISKRQKLAPRFRWLSAPRFCKSRKRVFLAGQKAPHPRPVSGP